MSDPDASLSGQPPGTEIRIELSPVVALALDALADSQLYGTTREEVAITLIREGIRGAINAKTIKLMERVLPIGFHQEEPAK